MASRSGGGAVLGGQPSAQTLTLLLDVDGEEMVQDFQRLGQILARPLVGDGAAIPVLDMEAVVTALGRALGVEA